MRKPMGLIVLGLFIFCTLLNFTAPDVMAQGGRPSAQAIPNGSIIIGTHIVDLGVLNMEILEIALASADEYNQSNVY